MALAAILLVLVCASGELLSVTTLTRHGNRAPNLDVQQLCPRVYKSNESIQERFGVIAQGLTRVGISQAYDVGRTLRKLYIDDLKFVPPTYSVHANLWYMQARGQPRHQQTLNALAYALFPEGTGPDTLIPHRAQPIPYASWPTTQDNLLHPPFLCSGRIRKDAVMWTATKGKQFVADNAAVVESASKVCGIDVYKSDIPALTLKEIADSLENGMMEGLPSPFGITDEEQWKIIRLAFAMFRDELYGSDEQITYWGGDFPQKLLHNFDQALGRAGHGPVVPVVPQEQSTKMYLYVCSRELSYAIGDMLGIHFRVPGASKGAIIPGTTISFELHLLDYGPVVRALLLIPDVAHADTIPDPVPVRMNYCGEGECTYKAFKKIFTERWARTGTWHEQCTPQDQHKKRARDMKLKRTDHLHQHGAGNTHSLAVPHSVGVAIVGAVVAAIILAVGWRHLWQPS